MPSLTDTAVESNPNPHPELAQAPWANERYEDEYGGVVDRLCIDLEEFEVRVEQFHHPADGGLESLPPDVLVRWEQHHTDGSNPEDLCIPLEDAPRLILALQSVVAATEVKR